MKYFGPLLVVKDIEQAKRFYTELLGMEIEADCNGNIALKGGVSLQEQKLWEGFIRKEEKDMIFYHNTVELYFEEEDLEGLLRRLEEWKVKYVHPLIEHRWGQRVVRFRDPDGHIIEIGEPMPVVIRRFLAAGMTKEETAKRMDVTMEYLEAALKES